MARHVYGGQVQDFVVTYGTNGELLLAASTEVLFFDAQTGGTQYTDLTDLSDGPTTVVSDSNGAISTQFKGPDGVRAMWADANGGAGPRQLMVDAQIGPDLATATNDAADLDNAVTALQALTASMPVTVVYDEVALSWPARPDIAGSRIVFWHGPNASPPPSGYMATNDVFFGWAA